MRLLLLLLLAAGASASETAWHNISGYTSTEAGIREFSVLVIADGKVVATGGNDLLSRFPDAHRIDGAGRFVLPGLTDAHAHMFGLGQLASNLDLAGTPDVRDAARRIAAFAADNPHLDWIQGRGWNQVLWPGKKFPSAADIDAVVKDRPVWLRRVDGHAGWANSAALAVAGIDDHTMDPAGGTIHRDANGHATGILIDKAMGLMTPHLPEVDKSDIRAAYDKAIASVLALGLTSVHDAGISVAQAEVYMSMAAPIWMPSAYRCCRMAMTAWRYDR
ncbi:MAG: amidohydrolase family protein [Gammaproteobacteria bacterium]|nr:amidohydrolase family protein [Gammaproteobacteria bacterium]